MVSPSYPHLYQRRTLMELLTLYWTPYWRIILFHPHNVTIPTLQIRKSRLSKVKWLSRFTHSSTKQWHWRSDQANATSCPGSRRCAAHCDQRKLSSLRPSTPFLDFQPTLPPAAVPVTEGAAKSVFHPGLQFSDFFSLFFFFSLNF